ncbi:uncharacterized protein TM35_000981100 [Trypanosoma theileri]|uniref:Mucin-like glycoprotein n=1 Tax=Trypanosoma theileri TaxID=67003 RepID=A0A1X0NEC4_9TRYP|nr:uncharacterized protein TM35_000981100 [Trypanosoma theileri]ORC82107.1 hypothetical protein TM35_000981100 [Trypanosoma theileri]
MMMMMMRRVMCVLAVVLCCACGYTMTATASNVASLAPYWRDYSYHDYTKPVVEVSCLADKAPLVRRSGESKWRACTSVLTEHDCEPYKKKCTDSATAIFSNLYDNPNLTIPDPHVKGQGTLGQGKNENGEPGIRGVEPAAGQGHQDTIRPQEVITEEKSTVHDSYVETSGIQQELTPVPATVPSPTKATEPRTTPEGKPESERTENPRSGEHSTEEVDTKQTNPQTQSENTTTSSKETNTTIPSSTENTVSEESTATPSRDSNLTQQSTATDDVTAAPNSPETNTTSTTPPSSENTTTTTTTLPPAPDTQVSSNITSTVQNKANVDSSVNPVWMRTAAPLLIVAVLFSVTVY